MELIARGLRRNTDSVLPKTEIPGLACLACGERTRHRYLYSRHGRDVLQCEVCGLGRTEAAGFDPTTYYTAEYFSGQHAEGYADYLGTERVLRREFARTVAFVRRTQPSGRLLEIGCAYGFFLQEAKRYFDVSGIELAEDAAAHCRRNGLNVLTGFADGAAIRQLGKMDVIVLFDVIEHLPNPRETLVLCRQHLNPGGVIVLTTGDFGSAYSRLAGTNWRLMTPPQHLWFFTRESMKRLADSLGYQTESSDHPWKIVPLSLILFQVGRMLGLGAKGPTVMSRVGIPINLFDVMRIVLRKPLQA